MAQGFTDIALPGWEELLSGRNPCVFSKKL